jgi:hypothetical protein
LDSPHLHRIDAKIYNWSKWHCHIEGSHLFQFKMLVPEYSNGSAWQRIKKPHVPVRRGEIQECGDSSCYNNSLHILKFCIC